jgi:hypothetical protein
MALFAQRPCPYYQHDKIIDILVHFKHTSLKLKYEQEPHSIQQMILMNEPRVG